MKDYSKKSDFEVSHEVAMLWLKDYRYEYYQHGTCDGVEVYSECGFVDRYDYCNNPSDAWPIMEENKIGLAFVNGEWRASSVNAGYHEYSDNSAFRAAMIVYLMMKDEE